MINKKLLNKVFNEEIDYIMVLTFIISNVALFIAIIK